MKTMNLPTAAGLFMRPVTVYGGCTDEAIIKEKQEQMVMEVLSKSTVSLSARDIRVSAGMSDFPLTVWQDRNYCNRLRAVPLTLMRLERKGKIISTLYGGCRLYFIPLSSDELMKNLLKGGEN